MGLILLPVWCLLILAGVGFAAALCVSYPLMLPLAFLMLVGGLASLLPPSRPGG
jgi:hypothetical protein